MEGRGGQRGSAVQFTCCWPALDTNSDTPGPAMASGLGLESCWWGVLRHMGLSMGFVMGNHRNHGNLMKQRATGGKEVCRRALRGN